MVTAGAAPSRGAGRARWLCLAMAAAMAVICVFLRLSDGGSADRLRELSAQAAEQKAAQEQLETLEARLLKRENQLAEARENQAASPDDAALASKLERAQGEYEKALRNRDAQLAKTQALPPLETLEAQIAAGREAGADRSLAAHLLLTAAFALTAAFVALRFRRIDLPVLLSLIGLWGGGVLMAFSARAGNLAHASSPDQAQPGIGLLLAGMGLMALCHALFWAFLKKEKADLKLALGGLLVLGGAGLGMAGVLKNHAPDAARQYINSMSPGFMNIFVGVILFILGTAILALPLRRFKYDIRKNPILLLMALPSVVYFLITSYLPMVGVYFAFTSYQFTTDFFSTLFGSKFVGLSNFAYLFSSGMAWRMTANTLIYNFVFIVGGTILKVGIAIMFSEIAGKYYKKAVQTITFLPHFISMVMVGTFAYNLLNYNSGVINSLLTSLGLPRADFYSSPGAWYVIIPLVDFWKGVGYGSIIYVSAITGISDELYEAADLDGANFMQEMLHITIPSIRPTIVILTLMSLGSIMKGNFDLFYQLVGEAGQLMETTEIIDTYVWRSLRQNVQIGMGSAAGLYQSFVGMILVVLTNTIVKKIEPDYALF